MAGFVALVASIVVGLAVLGLVGAGIAVMLVRLLPGKPTPEDILRERYARGEIGEEQFEAMRQRLAGPGQSRAA